MRQSTTPDTTPEAIAESAPDDSPDFDFVGAMLVTSLQRLRALVLALAQSLMLTKLPNIFSPRSDLR